MKKHFQLLTVGAVTIAMTVLAACGSTSNSATSATTTSTSASAASAETADTAGAAGTTAASTSDAAQTSEATSATTDSQADSQETSDSETWDGDIDEINVMLFDLRGVGENSQPITDAMNAITEKTCGVHANIQWIDMGSYASQASMIFATREQVDVLSITPHPAC